MEKELNGIYKQAYREARETADRFMQQFRQMDKQKRQQIKDESDKDKQKELKEDYERWRRTQIFQGNRYHQMADTLAADMAKTNQIAASVINGHMPEVYAVNHNYATYEIEKGSKFNTQYTLYDAQTVERLMRDKPDLLPRKAAVNIPKDEQWNKQHINSAVLQGILQGKSNDDIAKDLATTITTMSHTSAIRNARTMTTSAENGGRIDSYKRAESMGINMLQVWVATLDGRTRHEHIQLDGQKRKVGEPFVVDGYKIDFPGDPSAEPFLVYNCRCCLIGEVEGVNLDLSDTSQRESKLGNMTYEQWKESKKKPEPKPQPKQDNKPQPTPQPQQEPATIDVPAPVVENPEYKDEPIESQFVPATTKEEAEQYALRFAENVNYNGISLENANKINETLTELTTKYPINQLEEITNKTRGSAVMSANYKRLNIDGKSLGKTLDNQVKDFKERQKALQDYIDLLNDRYKDKKAMPEFAKKAIKKYEETLKFSRWGVNTTVEDKVKATVAHEYGHIIADQYFGQINRQYANPNYKTNWDVVEMSSKWDRTLKKARKTGDIYNLSEYGNKNSQEFFAECFAARVMGETLPDYVEELMKEVLDNGIM